MIECQECDEGQIQKIQTPYGCKEVCDACGHVAKDVDTYAGVMVWSHKTAPEIEIHASKASAAAVLDSNRSRVVRNPVRVAHHAPQEMGGRRQNTGRVKDESAKIEERLRPAARSSAGFKQRRVEIPEALKQHVMPIQKGDSRGLRSFTSFTKNDVNLVMSALPSTGSIDELCSLLNLRSTKTKKPLGILSWLSAYGHADPPQKLQLYSEGGSLVIHKDRSPEQEASYAEIDRETRYTLGYTTGTSRYNRI